jgi:pimeloyl-ACP methyl ester carboxylesterase
LNLGVKLNEATNFTVLMPDLRGHGQGPLVEKCTFGGCEGDDVAAALVYLRSLKSVEDMPLVGKEIGLYGIEMGALTGLNAAAADPQ